jgi:hypothetical protein
MGFCRGNARRLLELQPNRQFFGDVLALKKVAATLLILQHGAEPLFSGILKTSRASRMFSWTGSGGLDPFQSQQFEKLEDRSGWSGEDGQLTRQSRAEAGRSRRKITWSGAAQQTARLWAPLNLCFTSRLAKFGLSPPVRKRIRAIGRMPAASEYTLPKAILPLFLNCAGVRLRKHRKAREYGITIESCSHF